MNTPDDYLVSDSGGAPPMSPLVQQPGIGLGGTSTPEQDREQFVNSRSTMGRIALPFQEFRAGRRGRPTEFEQLQQEKQKERQRTLEEIKVFSQITNETFEEAENMTGPARDQYIALRAKTLNALSPGSGDLLTSLADDPEYGKLVMKNAEKSPTLKTALEVGGIRKAREMMKSTEGAKLVRSEIEGAELPQIRTRLQTLGMAAQELMPPERYKQMQADGFISPNEVAELNEVARQHPKYKAAALSDTQLELAARYEDATYGMSGFATSKTAQEALAKGPQSTVGKIKADLKAGRISQAEADAAIEKSGGVNINLGAPVSGVDAQGNPVFFQPDKKGGKPTIVPGVTPRPTGNPILGEVAKLIAEGGKGNAAPKANKYKVGDNISKAGKQWKVTGFDKDGEPLVEEVKKKR